MNHIGQAIEHTPVAISVDSIQLEGYLSVPTAASSMVVFAHGSGSSRHSPRNRFVADVLNEAGLATLLIDLLNSDEQEVDLQTSRLRFDIPFLANRLVSITQWLREQPQAAAVRIGRSWN
jgi:putative phosphoribosyl transferase